ncbi:MAG: type II toxin-antitoxin system RelE/ParE family toxin [Methanobrevibacter sp.]|nr:type II toxin-antitoxin system RelE/ParE family toxin [Methanobrevibacter sp.]
MPSDKDNYGNPVYDIFEDKLAIKFREKHSNDLQLQNRIDDKYYKLAIDPIKETEDRFKSKKCPKCKKTRMGNYRIIYYINKPMNAIQIIDIGPRKNIYKKWN